MRIPVRLWWLVALAALSPAAAMLAEAADDRSGFTKAVAASRIWGFLEIFRNSGLPEEMLSAADVTMIIPIDTAFYRLTPEEYRALLAPENKELAARYIRAHVVPGHFTIEQLAAGGVKTMDGIALQVLPPSTADVTVTINGCRVTLADQTGEPGMFHLIDGFLFKP